MLQVKTLTADSSKAKYLCQLHLVAGVMTFDTLKKSDEFYTLTGKSAEIDTSEGVRRRWRQQREEPPATSPATCLVPTGLSGEDPYPRQQEEGHDCPGRKCGVEWDDSPDQ